MKYLVKWEYCAEDLDKVVKKSLKAQEIAEKEPDRFGSYLYPPHHLGQYNGFSVVESTPEQIINAYRYWQPEMKIKFKPISDTAKMIETYLKSK